MKKISFTLQDAPYFWHGFETDFHPTQEGVYSVTDEIAILMLINNEFPNLKESRRRVKRLRIIDEENQRFESPDVDILGNIHKHKIEK